jgi:hypothetical protein
MISVELEKGVPLPVARQKYPYKEMEVGDSFFVLLAGYRMCVIRITGWARS